jgi:hypothetical protein
MVGVDRQKQFQKTNRERRIRPPLHFALSLALLFGSPVAGQAPYPQFPSAGEGKYSRHYPQAGAPFGDESSVDPKLTRSLNAARQKALVADTEKLLRLAQELNQEIAVSESSTLSDAQMRKVNEIGKLAKSVKEKMSYSVGAYPGLHNAADPRDR